MKDPRLLILIPIIFALAISELVQISQEIHHIHLVIVIYLFLHFQSKLYFEKYKQWTKNI